MKKIIKPLILSAALMAVADSIAETPDALLEQGIYLEETVGDLQSALSVYQQISENDKNHRKIVAEALYRQGAALNTLGENKKAEEVLNRLINQYSDVQGIAGKGRKLLNTLGESSLVFNEAPWENGELLTYNIAGPAGGFLGQESYHAVKTTEAGKSGWVIKYSGFFATSNLIAYNQVVVDENKFSIIEGVSDSTAAGEHSYTAGVGVLSLQQGDTLTQLPTGERIYEYSQIPYVLRRLSLEYGQKYRFPVYMNNSMSMGTAHVTVGKKEKVSVPSGTFDAWSVKVVINQGDREARELSFNVADDAKHTLVSIESTGLRMELVADSIAENTKRKDITLSEVGASFNVKETAQLADMKQFDPGMKALVLLRDFEDLSATMFASKQVPENMIKEVSIEQIIEGDLKVIEGFFQGYTPREALTKKLTVDGMPAYFYVADYSYEGKPQVESRIYMKGKDHIYWFILRCKKQDYDAVASEFERNYISFKRNEF